MKLLYILLIMYTSLVAEDKLVGIVKAIYDGEISVATDGIVSNILKKEGDSVKKGETILKLDDQLQRLETQRRKIAFEDKTQLLAQKKSIVILKNILQNQETLYKETHVISLNELNQLKMQYIKSLGDLESTMMNEKKEEMEYEIALKVLDYYSLNSPIKGVITKIIPEVGEWVQTGKAIIYIVDTRTCYVEIDLNAAQLAKIKLHDRATIEVINDKKIIKKKGSIDFISEVADMQSSLVRAKVYFNNSDKAVVPGVNAFVIF